MAQEGTLPYKDALFKMREKYEKEEPIEVKKEESPKGFFDRPRMNEEEKETDESIEDYLQYMFNMISEDNKLLKNSVVEMEE